LHVPVSRPWVVSGETARGLDVYTGVERAPAALRWAPDPRM